MTLNQTPAVAPLRFDINNRTLVPSATVAGSEAPLLKEPMQVISSADDQLGTPTLHPEAPTPRPVQRSTVPQRQQPVSEPERRIVLPFPGATDPNKLPPQLGTLENPILTPPPPKTTKSLRANRFSESAMDYMLANYTDGDGYVRAPSRKEIRDSGIVKSEKDGTTTVSRYVREIRNLKQLLGSRRLTNVAPVVSALKEDFHLDLRTPLDVTALFNSLLGLAVSMHPNHLYTVVEAIVRVDKTRPDPKLGSISRSVIEFLKNLLSETDYERLLVLNQLS